MTLYTANPVILCMFLSTFSRFTSVLQLLGFIIGCCLFREYNRASYRQKYRKSKPGNRESYEMTHTRWKPTTIFAATVLLLQTFVILPPAATDLTCLQPAVTSIELAFWVISEENPFSCITVKSKLGKRLNNYRNHDWYEANANWRWRIVTAFL